MNYYDNYKLINYIREHNVEVVSCTPCAITVNTLFSRDGEPFYEHETIPASMPDVRAYLGY